MSSTRKSAAEQAQASRDLVETSLMPYVTLVFERAEPLQAAVAAAYANLAGEPPPPAVHPRGGRIEFVKLGIPFVQVTPRCCGLVSDPPTRCL